MIECFFFPFLLITFECRLALRSRVLVLGSRIAEEEAEGQNFEIAYSLLIDIGR